MRRRVGPILAIIYGLLLSASAQTGASTKLTLQEAIQRGLRANLSVLVADSRVAEAKGTAERRSSALYPRVRIDVPATVQSRNLPAQGIDFPGIPEVVGPFSTYDARVSADQAIIDLTALHASRGAQQQAKAARSSYQDTRDEVIRSIASLYLSAQSAAAQVKAAATRVETGQALYKLAADQKEAGVATGIDVLRAQVQLANDRQSLVQARNAEKEVLLSLQRNIGMQPGTPIELAEELTQVNIVAPAVEQAVQSALAERPDYQALEHQRDALTEQLKASHARFYPRLTANGNYGGIGRSIGSMTGTGLAQLSLSFVVFDRDRQGEEQEIEARLDRVKRQMEDLKYGIDQDIRQALLRLESAQEELTVANAGLDLSRQELELARTRFQGGVTNNIEVVNAQDSLARAQQNQIIALTRHADARIALARALGNTEATYTKYLLGQ